MIRANGQAADEEIDDDLDDGADGDAPEGETQEQLEARARTMGWKPQAEYRGDPRRWTDARAFIAHGEETLPILRDQNRRMSEKQVALEGRLSDQARTISEQAAAIQDAMKLARQANDAGYNRAMRELTDKRLEAVESGDTNTFKQVQEEIDAMETARREPAPTPVVVAKPAVDPAAVVLDPAITAFVDANPWFNSNPVLTKAMVDMHNAVIKESPLMDVADQLKVAKERLAMTFPSLGAAPAATSAEEPEDVHTERPRPRARAPVAPDAPDRRPRAPAPGALISSIADATERAQARTAFNNIQRQDPGFTEQEYMAMIDNPSADVLALRSSRT